MSAVSLEIPTRTGRKPTTDHHGLEITPTDARATEIYAQALHAFNSYRGDPIAIIDGALAHDPDFVMGLILRAHVHVSLWERSVVADVRSMLEKLEERAADATDREQRHIRALQQWAAGDWDGARVTLEHLNARYPRDLLALQAGHLADFFHGDRDNLRGRIARALPAWHRRDEGYGFVLGLYAFGLEECGHYGAAEDTGRRALQHEADDCWANHAVAHVMEMQGRREEGIAFMRAREAHWAQPDNGFAFHNWWHLALFHLDLGHVNEALAVYDDGVSADSSPVQFILLDRAALLWRMHLQGIDVGTRWKPLAKAYRDCDEAGFYAFNDMHALMAFVAVDDTAAADRWLSRCVQAASAACTNGAMTRAVGLPIARAVQAFGQKRYRDVVDELMPVRHRAHAFGGSHAQRDIVHRTLHEAALRSGDTALAAALLEDRLSLKPECPFLRRLRARAAA